MNDGSKPNFKLERVSGSPACDAELLDDLKLVGRQLNSSTLTQKQYADFGRYNVSTIVRHFHSWNKALIAAGLSLSNEKNVSDEHLFENLLVLWQHYGRQPRRRELATQPSTLSQSPYNRRFGSWTATLEAFVNYTNGSGAEAPIDQAESKSKFRRTTGRDPSLRLRWRVLNRDRFTCCSCGKSPASTQGIELQVDHKMPWSKGGETVLENLQTLCSICNIGKSNTH